MSIGSYPQETEAQAGRRRIVIGYIVFGVPPRLFFTLDRLSNGQTWVNVTNMVTWIVPAVALIVLARRPHWFRRVVHVLLASSLVENLVPTILLGGIIEAGLIVAWVGLTVIGALIALDRRAGRFWFVASVLSVTLAALLPNVIDPLYVVGTPPIGDIVGSLLGTAVFSYAAMAYFVRQRDRFQQQSDDLLHNILPNEIAARLKTDRTMIADDFPQVSVLFADVVGFTPMSATMTPPELVGLLNQVFTTFDEFAADLGCEKIKTVGDEYMVAAGVPIPRPDHAQAIAELALRIRDHVATHDFDGHRLTLRIGINSGPVVAGIIGTHKFSYDMWGDTVNTASRMESSGIPGQIQVSPATHELLSHNGYLFEPRGLIDIKGKGQMDTWILAGHLRG